MAIQVSERATLVMPASVARELLADGRQVDVRPRASLLILPDDFTFEELQAIARAVRGQVVTSDPRDPTAEGGAA